MFLGTTCFFTISILFFGSGGKCSPALDFSFPFSLSESRLHFVHDTSATSFLAEQSIFHFKALHRTLENGYHKLDSEDVGVTRRKADIVSCEEEKLLDSGVFSTDTHNGVLAAIFYYNCMNFILRGGEEHRSLKLC